MSISSLTLANQSPTNQAPLYRQWQVWLLVLLVLAVYFTRLTRLPIRGEEPRRAQVAREMLASGDFLVPRQQGQPFLSRPPLQNWLIALTTVARGRLDLAAVRLHAVLATLATSLLVYWYAQRFLTRPAALAAAAGYATMLQVMELGRLAETEATLTVLLTAALLFWHAGYEAGWPKLWTWTVSYALVAAGVLAKGPQAPVYFVGAVGLFLLVRRDWRTLISWQHAAGLFTLAALVGAWQIPFHLDQGWSSVRAIYGQDVAMRFEDTRWLTIARHLVTYPLEILVCTAPWSLLLAGFLYRPVRQLAANQRGYVLFLLVALLVSFPSCWLTPGARTRYYMPLYPCIAVLAGVVVDRCLAADAARRLLSRTWTAWAVAAVLISCGVLAVSVFAGPWPEAVVQPVWFAVMYAAAGVLLAAVLLWHRASDTPRRCHAAVLAAAAFAGLTYTGLVTNVLCHSAEDSAPAVAQLKQQLPPGTELVSFGLVHHQFAYHYREPIPVRPLPQSAEQVDPSVEYFCFEQPRQQPKSLPFAWETVAEISCDKNRRDDPRFMVVVGRRVSEVASGNDHPPAAKRR